MSTQTYRSPSRWLPWLVAGAWTGSLSCALREETVENKGSATAALSSPSSPAMAPDAGPTVPTTVPCGSDELCVEVSYEGPLGDGLLLILYRTEEQDWPRAFASLPTPGWIVKTPAFPPGDSRVRLRIPLEGHTMTIAGGSLEGARLGLVVVREHSALMTISPTAARGFSGRTLEYHAASALDFGTVDLRVPSGKEVCDINPWNPRCLTGGLFWKTHLIGEPGSVPGAMYMDVADLDGDGILDIVVSGQPHFENPSGPLELLKLGAYYLGPDGSVRRFETVDHYSTVDPGYYSPWGVKVIRQNGAPLVVVGTSIPGLLPLREGRGTVFAYRPTNGGWQRSIVVENPTPKIKAYNSMLVVPCDVDLDGDDDLILSGSGLASAVGNWMENTGTATTPWVAHVKEMAPNEFPHIRGTLAYACKDVSGDGYPDAVYNALFDVPNTSPPTYRGEIWLGVHPGPLGNDAPFRRILVEKDNWAAADIVLHDIDEDGHPDILANNTFRGTVSFYRSPGGSLDQEWAKFPLAGGLKSASDMALADMDGDSKLDLVINDHTGHQGYWWRNPGPGPKQRSLWEPRLVFRGVRTPGDLVVTDMDHDGDLDIVSTSLTLGQPVLVEQVQPAASLVATLSLPADFRGKAQRLIVGLSRTRPMTGPPEKVLAYLEDKDADGDGESDLGAVLAVGKSFPLTLSDVGVTGTYHVFAALYVEGGGAFVPLPGKDFVKYSDAVKLGSGLVRTALALEPVR